MATVNDVVNCCVTALPEVVVDVAEIGVAAVENFATEPAEAVAVTVVFASTTGLVAATDDSIACVGTPSKIQPDSAG